VNFALMEREAFRYVERMWSGMRVSLFVPCFVDAFYPNAGMSIVRVLERLGHSIDFPESLTCCGQPAFNSGYWDEARAVASRVVERLRDSEAVVIASGSCGAMLKVFYPQIFQDTKYFEDAQQLSAKTWEFSDFLVTKLGVTDVGARFPSTVTFHDGCHGLRELNIQSQPRQLLANVRDLELVEMSEAQTCCGFGGAFAAKFASISTAMGEVKTDSALSTGARYIVSNDSSCLMHIQGLLGRQKQKMQCLHLAEVLVQQ
jgi:L-lactate dehydrogenase complex protein LldE